jgi:2-succinyl-6-hydroxy-2,4-cyclohexadiene-1-carboxylate synthase
MSSPARCALLHGFAGDPSVWDAVIAAWQLPLAPHPVALPGHGGGPVLARWDDNLAAVAKAVAGCALVVGYSLGARIALGLVASGQAPRAVLVGCNPGIADAERAARHEADAAWARMLRDEGIAAFEAAWTVQPLFATQQRVPPALRDARRARRLAHDPEQLAQSLEVMGLAAMPDYRPVLPAIADRIALIAGADDDKFVAIARSMPAVSLELIAGSGHDPTLEQPALLAAAIARAAAVWPPW